MKNVSLAFGLLFYAATFAAYSATLEQSAEKLLTQRVADVRDNFYVYKNADSGFNFGFPSGFFTGGGAPHPQLLIACVDDPSEKMGCTKSSERFDTKRGTVFRIRFPKLTQGGQFSGINFEEPEGFGNGNTGKPYDMRGSSRILFEARAATSVDVKFGADGLSSNLVELKQGNKFQTFCYPLLVGGCDRHIGTETKILKPNRPVTTTVSVAGEIAPLVVDSVEASLDSVKILFTVSSADSNGGVVLVDNIRYLPAPRFQSQALGFPSSTETFGIKPRTSPANSDVRVAIPPDQVNRNLAATYEASMIALAFTGSGSDISRKIADTLVYAWRNDHARKATRIRVSPDGDRAFHNAYMNGNISLFNDQPEGERAGKVRLSGFTGGHEICGAESPFCLVFSGSTGGNNAFAIMALVAAYYDTGNANYLEVARSVGGWIISMLKEERGAVGLGGYSLGYEWDGSGKLVERKAKSVENNASIYAAFMALASAENALGRASAEKRWRDAAEHGANFALRLFDERSGCFHAGTVPEGTLHDFGIAPEDVIRGDEMINTFRFLDATSIPILTLSGDPKYKNAIDWTSAADCLLSRFKTSVGVGSNQFDGFHMIQTVDANGRGPAGISWEFTAQVITALRYLSLSSKVNYKQPINTYLKQLTKARDKAPFGDGQGLVASTLADGDEVAVRFQCLTAPFQCIPERVGLAATTWALFASRSKNPMIAAADKDGDQIPNLWDEDDDDDGLSDQDEAAQGTDPLNPDTDGDGILDGKEKGNNGNGQQVIRAIMNAIPALIFVD